jgi:hypothetical protein
MSDHILKVSRYLDKGWRVLHYVRHHDGVEVSYSNAIGPVKTREQARYLKKEMLRLYKFVADVNNEKETN